MPLIEETESDKTTTDCELCPDNQIKKTLFHKATKDICGIIRNIKGKKKREDMIIDIILQDYKSPEDKKVLFYIYEGFIGF